MKRFAITMGDPCGIGAEIIVKALKSRRDYIDKSVIFGNADIIKYYISLLNFDDILVHKMSSLDDVKDGFINVYDSNPAAVEEIPIGKISKIGGECAFSYVCKAIKAVLDKKFSSVVTAPLNKEALHLAGHFYAGHTEIFADLSGGDNFAMLLWSDKLKAIHVTTHIPLHNIFEVITKERIIKIVKLADETLKKLGYKIPRIAVAGINPHAGENGIFGNEEIEIVIPAVKECLEMNINVRGPIAPDTVFLRALKGEFDIVAAMYHDQGHIPIKLLAFDTGVNITVGLNIIRTSVDHGTAFDIAGKLEAKEQSLIKAIEIAEKLSLRS
ncbi:MAG: 4-hydroxythreonine-4-phosphate dehydrogenase PdxA [Elusimicrobiota bacterium]|jgi:4-hydroxythreonine-4-phosphate dehydrogenase|nr:4-hydroxythreonine-4-phosphate dehydrogenase PdxA [Elusimicrobiota bacterium]